MAIYRWVWAGAWSAALVLPAFFGALSAPFPALFTAAVLAAACGAVFGRRHPGDLIVAGVLAAVGVAVLWWLGAAAWLVALAMTVSAPATVRSLMRLLRGDPAGAPPGAARATADISWSESYVALHRARTPDERLAIVVARQAYLDDLEARDAAGFRSWLQSGARPVGNPERPLRPR